MKKVLFGLVAMSCCCACGAPSLRYKYQVNQLVAQGQFEQAASAVQSQARKAYGKKDGLLYALDRGVLLHDAQHPQESDVFLSQAQQQITDLYTKSISANFSRVVINDLMTPYYAANYETALTFFYRALNFLQQQDVMSAAVEARKAVFFLDHLRVSKKNGYNDDPFVQYVASLIFESAGELSDARIARQNAVNAYQKRGWPVPQFTVPAHVGELGEVILFHYVGQIPLKKSQTIQLAWHKALAFANAPVEDGGAISPEVQNAVYAGLTGSAITVAIPVLEEQTYAVQSSQVQVNGIRGAMYPASDLTELITQDLDEKMPGIWFRLATRAVLKRVAAVQARHAIDGSEDGKHYNSAGHLAEMLVSLLGAATEKADTRQWFTLPARIYMTRVFVTPGPQNIQLLLQDKNGNIIGTHTFENVIVRKGERIFLHHRTAY